MTTDAEYELLGTFDLQKINAALGTNYTNLAQVHKRFSALAAENPRLADRDASAAAAALGRLGGRSTSEPKKAASRENGKAGGRPVATYTGEDGIMQRGRAARAAWKNQAAACGCGAAGDPKHIIEGTTGGLDARWLGCPYCRGSAVGRPLVFRRA